MKKIVSLPQNLNPDIMIQKKIDEKYGVCPFCGTAGTIAGYDRWCGKHDEHDDFKYYANLCFSPDRIHIRLRCFRFWEKNHRWEVTRYSCGKCGAEWESEPYRVDIQKEAVSNMWME